MTIKLVLFDLDGTLIDSAPALGAAANAVRRSLNLPELPLNALREVCGKGVRGLLWEALRLPESAPVFETCRETFLTYYRSHINEGCGPFDGIVELLRTLETRGIAWGIVTNKHADLAALLCQANGLAPTCLVGGNTTPHPKPAPDPILHALTLCRSLPEHTVYVGDDQRDMMAGRAAGCRTVAAAWGYTGHKEAPYAWGADRVASTPSCLLDWL